MPIPRPTLGINISDLRPKFSRAAVISDFHQFLKKWLPLLSCNIRIDRILADARYFKIARTRSIFNDQKVFKKYKFGWQATYMLTEKVREVLKFPVQKSASCLFCRCYGLWDSMWWVHSKRYELGHMVTNTRKGIIILPAVSSKSKQAQNL